MDLYNVYTKTPVWFQNLMCSAQGWNICRRRYNKEFYTELARYESGYYHQAKELLSMLENIRGMSVYAPYLKDINWDALRMNPKMVYSVIMSFPIIDKAYVKSNIKSFENPYCNEPYIIGHTSGTTGGGLHFPYTIRMEYKQWAVWWRYRRALGIELNTWCGWFGGKPVVPLNSRKPPFWRINYAGKQVMFSSYHMTLDNIFNYHDEIKRRRITWLHGYPSHLTRFAALVIERELQPLLDIKRVTTGAENLLDNQISIIQTVFPNAIIRQHYGLAEGVANFSQDLRGHWNIDDDFAYVEFIPVDENNNNVCHIVGTSFSNYAFPLVRYDTGDIVTIKTTSKDTVEIVSIDGRSADVIKFPDGKESRIPTVMSKFTNIVESQFHQTAIDKVELHIVKGHNYTAKDERSIKEAVLNWLGNDISLELKYVEKVERTKSGKIKSVISEIV